jgi:hypothetical protein
VERDATSHNMAVLWEYLEKNGRMVEVYTDRDSMFAVPPRPKESEPEGKNGAVVRKRIGYGYIAGERAEAIGKFYARHLNPYLNFHRPCGFATVSLDERGKRPNTRPNIIGRRSRN